MTLKELQKMIKEELDAFVQNENINEVDVDVDTDAGDMEMEKGGESEDMLRKIYDMLKDKFEAEDMGDKDSMEEDMMDEDMMDEVKDDDKKMEEADLEERASQGFGDPGVKNTAGPNAGYTPAKTTKGDGKLHESVLRFQKLANIIK